MRIDFSARSEYYDAIFQLAWLDDTLLFRVMKPDKPEKERQLMINGFPLIC